MTRENQEFIFNEIVQKCGNILTKKGDDYAQNTDRLSNFKLAGAIAGGNAQINVLNLIGTKVARLSNLLVNKDGTVPNNESVEDSVIDLINYGMLLYMILSEKKIQ